MRNIRFLKDKEGVTSTARAAAVILIGLIAGGGLFYVEQASAASATPTLTVQTSSQISLVASAQIQVSIANGNPSSSYAVTIEVAPPTPTSSNNFAGGPFCDTVTVATGASGSGQATVSYPDTGVSSADFAACTAAQTGGAAGTGGPSTELAGSYAVTASTTGIASASTSFSVVAPAGLVTGSGTYSTTSVRTYFPIACAPASATCVGGYQVCSGYTGTPTTTTVLNLNWPSTGYAVGSQVFTGVITTNTPGQSTTTTVYNPCFSPIGTPTTPPTTVETESFQTLTLSDVTICLGTVNSGSTCSGNTISGGLTIVETATSILAGNPVGQGIVPPSTTSQNWYQLTLTGSGGLTGLSGNGAALVTFAAGVAGTGSYWVQLTNVPGGASTGGTTGGGSSAGNYCGYYTQNGVQVQFTNLSQSAANALIAQYPPGADGPC